jgi:hypothetical protein
MNSKFFFLVDLRYITIQICSDNKPIQDTLYALYQHLIKKDIQGIEFFFYLSVFFSFTEKKLDPRYAYIQ